MNYVVISHHMLTIISDCEIPIPLSHPMPEMEARRFANARRFLSADWKTARVIPESKFKMLGGI